MLEERLPAETFAPRAEREEAMQAIRAQVEVEPSEAEEIRIIVTQLVVVVETPST
jgi:hypothetical protein